MSEPQRGNQRGPAGQRDWIARHRAAGGVPVPSFGTESSVPARFAKVAARHPERPAVATNDGVLDYRELAARAGGVAAVLDRHGLVPGDRVGLLLGHGTEPVVAILGTLAAGCAYVPLDPEYPVDRLAAVLADATPGLVLTTGRHAALAAALCGRDTPVALVEDAPGAAELPVDRAGPDTSAYLLYTSGSTGRPKGVRQNHRNVLYGARTHATSLCLRLDDRTSVLSSFGFDMAVTDLFTALLNGAAAVPVDARSTGLAALAETLDRLRVTVYHSTPTLYRYLTGALPGRRLSHIRAVLLGGEEVTRLDLDRCRRYFAPGCVFINGYGATEVSFALQNHFGPADDPPSGAVLPVGYPLPGLRVELVGETAGADGTGEITVRGSQVALGYANDPGRTAERFVDHGDGTRTYRTGDLGRRLPDGSIRYLGRLDRQVKIRGYRVEPGEVEAALAALPGVAGAAVVARPADPATGRDAELTGYAVPTAGAAPTGQQLRRMLADRLPHFLVPAAIVVLPAFPLTATGKVDTAALPRQQTRADRDVAAHGTAAVIAAAWRAELGHGGFGVRDNFFDVGGHSLLLARVHGRLERELDRVVDLSLLYRYPTIGALAGYLEQTEAEAGDEARLARTADRLARRRAARQRVRGER